MNHYFDANKWYTDSMPSGQGECPPNASREVLPPKPWPVGTLPRFSGEGWVLTSVPQPQTTKE